MFTASLLLASSLAFVAAEPAAPSARTPEGHHLYRSYGRIEGLTDPLILHLMQDSRGYLWAATDDGVFRFDGQRFERLGTDRGLPENTVTALFEDAEHHVLVGTEAGLAHVEGGQFATVSLRGAHARARILAMTETDGRLWVGTQSGLLSGESHHVLSALPEFEGTAVHALLARRADHALWLTAARDGDAFVMRRHGDLWERIDSPDEGPGETIDSLVEDGLGHVWARTGSQLWRYDESRDAFANVVTPPPLTATYGALAPSGREGMWVPSEAALLHWDGQGWHQLAGDAYGARAVLEDADGSVWIASRDLHRMLGRGVFQVYDRGEGLPGSIVWSIFRDSDRAIWFGTDDGLVYTDGARFYRVPGTEGFTVRSIVQSGESLYFAGSSAHHIYRVDRRTARVTGMVRVASRESRRIYRLAFDARGALWACTDADGVLAVDDTNGSLPLTPVDVPGFGPREYVSDLSLDHQGRLLIAAQTGLYVREGERWRHFDMRDGLMANHVAYARPLSSGGDWLVAFMDQANGVATLRYRDGKIEVLSEKRYSDRLADRVYFVADDPRGAIWIGTGRGVDRWYQDQTTHYGALDGIAGEDTASMAILVEPQGDLWFGAVGGLTRYDARHADALPPIHPPRVDVQHLSIGGLKFDPGTARIEVPSSRNWLEARLAAPGFLGNDPTQFKVQLGGVDLAPVVGSGFEVRYPGLTPGTYRFTAAARLPPGSWGPPTTFELTVDSPWWETPWARFLALVSLVLVVLGLVRVRTMRLQAINTALERRVTARTEELRHANEDLQAEVRERKIAEGMLQARNDELNNTNHRLAEAQQQLIQAEKMATVGQLAAGVAHEINNPIGFVQSNISTLSKYIDALWKMLDTYEQSEIRALYGRDAMEVLNAARERLELEYIRGDCGALLEETADGIGRVRRIVEDLKNFSRLENPEWQSVDIHTCIESAIKLSAHEVKYKAEIVRDYGQLPQIHCLPFQLNQVFLNLLVNAAQAIARQGVIRIRTRADIEGISIEISDTGGGIPKPMLARIFDPFFTTKPIGQGTGLGLSVSYGIIARHHGRIEVDSELGKGTTFQIWLPLDAREQEKSQAA